MTHTFPSHVDLISFDKVFVCFHCFFMLILHNNVSVKTKRLYNLSVSTTRGLSITVNEMGALLTSNLTDTSTSSSVGEKTSLLTSQHCCLSSIVFSATVQINPLPPVYTTKSMASVCKWSSLCIVRHVSLNLNNLKLCENAHLYRDWIRFKISVSILQHW